MEAWRRVFRDGLAPLLSTRALEALRTAILRDDPQLVQGATTVPPPLQCVQDWPVEGACLIGFAGWKGEDLEIVADVESWFARTCFDVDQRLGEPAGVRFLLNFFDGSSREVAFAGLLPEINRELARRGVQAEEGSGGVGTDATGELVNVGGEQ